MLKYLAHSFISVFFVIAILGPSIFQLCAKDINPVVLTISEEEVKEKIFFITDYFSQNTPSVYKKELNTAYIEKRYTHNAEILLPPPEHNS
ncbi:MAG: hypothetical protein R2781_01985 [Flavobacteriaceae bacterium]